MKPAKMREFDAVELESQLRELNEQMFRLRLQMRLGQSDGLKKYRALRKDRARIMTIARERELASQEKG
jgi:large subunit ribosomal protein L29